MSKDPSKQHGFGRSNIRGTSGPEGFHGDGELSRKAIKKVMPHGLRAYELEKGRYTKFQWPKFKAYMIPYALLTDKPL